MLRAAPRIASSPRPRRHEANDALKRGYAWIGAVTWFYRLGALSYAVATGLAVLALARLDVPREQGLLVVALTSLMSAVMLIGAMVILFRPFAWTLTIAVLATVVSVVHAVGPNPFGMAALGSAAWAALAWAALVPTYRFHQLIEQHKDMYILHHASAKTRRSLKDRSAEERHARLVGAMNRAAGKAWRSSTAAAALLCVAAGFGAYGVISTMRPSRLSDAVARFEAEWSGGKADGVVQLLPEGVRAVKGERFAGLAAGHWNAELPPLPAAALERDGNFARAEYDVAGIPVEAEWRLSDLDWVLTGLELPVPPLEPKVDALLAAWSSSDIDALVALFSDEAKKRMHDSIQVAARERGWVDLPSDSGDSDRRLFPRRRDRRAEPGARRGRDPVAHAQRRRLAHARSEAPATAQSAVGGSGGRGRGSSACTARRERRASYSCAASARLTSSSIAASRSAPRTFL